MAGRHPTPAKTALGTTMRAKRGDSPGEDAATALGIERGTYYRLERGTHAPSLTTAQALARWLGWTLEQVYEAAASPAVLPTALPTQR